jgi:hypothetical protein
MMSEEEKRSCVVFPGGIPDQGASRFGSFPHLVSSFLAEFPIRALLDSDLSHQLDDRVQGLGFGGGDLHMQSR